MEKLLYPAVFSPLEEQPGYCVTIPDLPGCVTQGESLEDAVQMAIDAASGWLLDELEDGNKLPPASHANSIKCEEGEFVTMLILDIDEYAEKYGNKAIRKNCTLPAWLNTIAEKANVNFSQVLQNALKQELGVTDHQ